MFSNGNTAKLLEREKKKKKKKDSFGSQKSRLLLVRQVKCSESLKKAEIPITSSDYN